MSGHHAANKTKGKNMTNSNHPTNTPTNTPVDFLTRFTQSDQFANVFDEGMGLVEETANYLDGPGREDARKLDRHGSIAYASESMRLTTRLMQLASWLLLQRAISSGELDGESAEEEKKRINLTDVGNSDGMTGLDQIPQALNDLVARSMRVHTRIMKLDKMITEGPKADTSPAENAITDQMSRLNAAFGSAK